MLVASCPVTKDDALKVDGSGHVREPEDSKEACSWSWQNVLRDVVVTQVGTSIIGAEVFLTSGSSAAVRLQRPPGGLFVAPEQAYPANDAIDGLIEASAPVASGMGIAGAHWAEHGASASGNMENGSRNGSRNSSKHGGNVFASVVGSMESSQHSKVDGTSDLEAGRTGRRTRVSREHDIEPSSTVTSRRSSIVNVSFGSSRATAENVKLMGSVKMEGQPLSSLLSWVDLTKLAKALFQKDFEAGDEVIKEGSRGNAFFIIKSGSVIVSTAQQGRVATLEEGAFFGEMALLNEEPRKATVTAASKVVCLVLERQAFTQLMGPLRVLLDRTAQSRARANSTSRRMAGATLEWKSLEQMVGNQMLVADKHMVAAASLFGQVATLSFGSESEGGVLVLYTCRASTPSLLNAPAVAAFARGAAKMAGMMLMYSQLKQGVFDHCKAQAHTEVSVSVQTARRTRRVSNEKQQGQPAGESVSASVTPPDSPLWAWLVAYARKFGGAKGAAPPKLGCSRAVWLNHLVCWVGVFLTLLAPVSGANQLASDLSEDTHIILVGSFGALMTLLYSAPASPLVQPRNVFFGNMLSASIAVLFFYLSSPTHTGVIPKWVAVALAPATSIAAMQVCGISHPPAGAASLIFISGGSKITNLGWMYLVTPLLIGNAICVICAMLINNLVKKRQYPVYW